MAYLVWALFICAAAHFIYGGIILPSIRFSLRSQLFNLRDQLRSLKINQRIAVSDAAYVYLQESINNAINLPRFDFTTLVFVLRGIRYQAALGDRIQERIDEINACSNPEIKAIHHKMVNIVRNVLIVNSIPWLFYLWPLLLVLWPLVILTAVLRKLRGILQRAVIRWIKVVISVPEQEIESVLPFDPMRAR